MQVEPPRSVPNRDAYSWFVAVIDCRCMPHVVVEYKDTARMSDRLHFGGIRLIGVNAVVSSRVVVCAMGARHKPCGAGFSGERREHPLCRDVHDRVRIGGRDVAGVVLIKWPVRMSTASLISRQIDVSRGERYSDVWTEQRLRDTGDTFLGQIEGEGLVEG